jgi:hypothetical protein
MGKLFLKFEMEIFIFENEKNLTIPPEGNEKNKIKKSCILFMPPRKNYQ